MSYEIKRLPLTFQAPLGVTWAGFLRPGHAHGIACTACGGTGQNPALRQLQADFYDTDGFGERWHYEWDRDERGRTIDASRRLIGKTRRWSDKLTQDEVDFLIAENRLWAGATAEAVNRWDRFGIGHDGINQHLLVRRRAQARGIWGYCPKCRGECVTYRSAAHRRSVEGWKPRELPSGEGYALWGTVTEGTPESPVFATPDALAAWLTVNFTSQGYFSHRQWLKLIEEGFAPSGIIDCGRAQSGLEAIMGSPDRWSRPAEPDPWGEVDEDRFPVHIIRGDRYHPRYRHSGWH